MVVVSNYKGIAARHETNSCRTSLFFKSILTFLLVKIPYFHTFTAAWAENSGVKEVHIIDAFCMSFQPHYVFSWKQVLLLFNFFNEYFLRMRKGIGLIADAAYFCQYVGILIFELQVEVAIKNP